MKPLSRPSLRALCLALLLHAAAPALAQLPNLGGEDDLPLLTERKLGDQVAKSIYRDPDWLDDPILTDYVQSLWQPLLQAARRRGDLTPDLDAHFEWQLFLARDPSFNAFATFGGKLGLHTGLLERTSHRAEVAAVLAHELAHVTQRHLARQVGMENRKQPWVLAAMLVGAAFVGRNPELANAAIVGGQAAAIQHQINYTRDMEREADRVGYEILIAAEFAPQGMVSMFEVMQRASRLNDYGNFPYLRTHPLNSERIADASNRAAQSSTSALALGTDTLALMMALRARLISGKVTDVLREAAAHPGSDQFPQLGLPARIATLYGAAYASHLLKDTAQARAHWVALERLLAPPREVDSQVKQAAWLLGLEIEAAHLDGNHLSASRKPAQERLDQFQRAWPTAQSDAIWLRSAVLLQSRLRLGLGQPQDLTENLPLWLAHRPRDAQAWRLLARAQEAQGQSIASVRSQAEAQAAELDYTGAVERLRAAQKLHGHAQLNDHDQSILQSRLRSLSDLQKKQAEDAQSLKQ